MSRLNSLLTLILIFRKENILKNGLGLLQITGIQRMKHPHNFIHFLVNG